MNLCALAVGLTLTVPLFSVAAAATGSPISAQSFPGISNPSPPPGAMPNGTMTQPPASPESNLPLPRGSRLTLQQAIDIALKYHPRLAEAAAQTAAGRERIGEAQAGLGPQVYGITQYLRTTENGIGNTNYYNPYGILPRLSGTNHNLPAGDTSQSWDTENNYGSGVSVSQFLFDFGRRRGLEAQRRYEVAGLQADQQTVELQLILEVSRRYFDLLRAQQLVRVYQQAIEQRRFHLHEATVKANAGLRPELDVYLTDAELQRAELHLVDAQNAVADGVAALDNALGLGDLSPQYRLVDVLTYSRIKDTAESLITTAFKLRPDAKSLIAEARAMGAEVRQDRSDYFPTVNAVGGYSAMGTGTPAVNNFNVGIVITWPIFNSFFTTHQIAEAQYRQKALQGRLEDLRQQIVLQVKTAFLDWQASVTRIRRAEKALAASRAELELSEKRYQAGLADIVELEDAQRNYTNDDAAYTNSVYSFAEAKAEVDEATGRSLIRNTQS
jgi:outer membrane protein TolC